MFHSGYRPFQCEFCDKKFTNKGEVKVHQRTHTGEKPYHCEYCKKGFSSNAFLKIHRKKHDKEKVAEIDFDTELMKNAYSCVLNTSHTVLGDMPDFLSETCLYYKTCNTIL